LVVGGPNGLSFHDSLNMGGVRMTERFLHSDPPTKDELAECGAGARELLAKHVPHEVSPTSAIGVAGTITSIAALDLGLSDYDPDQVQDHRLSRFGVRTQLERLASLPLAERREGPALDPHRAPVILARTLILAQLLHHLRLHRLHSA